jgi:single stranded DNA-binding protein
MSLHTMLLVGRSTKDAETLTSKSEKVFAKFSLAVNDYLGKEKGEVAHFYDILIFDKSAATAKEKIKKGDLVFIMGRPEVDAYISKKDDEPKGVISVIAETWKVIK